MRYLMRPTENLLFRLTVRFYIPSGDIVAVIDANTLETITELPYPADEVAVSPDGQKIALLGGYLYILNTSDFAVVFADSNLYYVENGIFSKDSKTFYFSTRTSHLNYLSLNGAVELTREIISTPNNKFTVWSVIPSSTCNKLYLYLKHYEEQYLFSFSVYDKALDSIIFTDSLIPGEGNIALTNDERYLIYTNPGRNDFTYPDPPFTFKIFNTGTLQIEDEISTILTSNKNDTVYFSVNEICLTPDNKLLLGTGLLEDDEVIICNLRKKEIEQTISLGGYRYLKRPTCQLQLKE
ncbi:MAG: hypothetical protein JXA92_02980 [candidate division Zixibacteria bacterium]|nr:hypothetical protein [candidate division Zixibacteria bacterium]